MTNDIVITPPDIQEALDDHKLYNSMPTRWATLEMAQFAHMRNVTLSIGSIFCGQKYVADSYIYYNLQKDGSVYKTHRPAL